MKPKYNVDEMAWAQFMDEFNDQFFNANITELIRISWITCSKVT